MPGLSRFRGVFNSSIFRGGYLTGRDNATIQKMDYGTEIITVLSWNRTVGANNPAGLGNAGVAGYILNATLAEKVIFPSDTQVTSGVPTLSTNRSSTSGASNSGSFGYAMGGSSVTTVDKITYATDSRTTLGTGLSVARGGSGALANYGVAAYAVGGETYTTVDKFAFSNDSRSTLGTGLSIYRDYNQGVSNAGSAGYVGGGFNGGGRNTFEKFAFSNDVRSVLSGTTTEYFWATSAFHDQGKAGYFASGCSMNFYSGMNTITKLSYVNDAISINAYTLSATEVFGAGVSDSI